ncbi:MAG: zinc-binding dehydrogenase [Candidatus Geothermarchaeales archaeon]
MLRAPYDIEIEEVEEPRIGSGDALVRIRATSICGTDVKMYKGEYKVSLPLIMGHETSGEVVRVGKGVKKIKEGDRVVIDPIFSCGKCYHCVIGRRNLCPHGGLLGREMNGSYSEYIAISEHHLFKIPRSVSFEEGSIIEGLGTVFHAQRRVKISLGDSVAILGQGPSGLLHTRLAKLNGANPIIATSRSDWKLELARKYGADVTINSRRENPVTRILEHVGSRGVDIAIESAGVPETITQSIKVVRPGGTVLIFGIHAKSINNFDAYPFYFKELSVVGSRAMIESEYEPTIRLVASGAVDVKPLITHRFPLERIREGFELVDKSPGSALRVIVAS